MIVNGDKWHCHEWRDGVLKMISQDDVIDHFELFGSSAKIDRAGINILYAHYFAPYGYSGVAFVLFDRDGKLWSVYGSHCSCYGLEGQWTEVCEETGARLLLCGQRDCRLSAEKGYDEQIIEVVKDWRKKMGFSDD